MDKKRSLEIKKDIYNGVPPEYHSALNDLYKPQEYENYSPVKRLENKLGISGIYQEYRIPNNMKPEEYEALMAPMRIFEMLERGYGAENESEEIAIEYLQPQKAKCLAEVRGMYKELVELNPELEEAEVRPNRISSYVAIISGACSGFPTEDIVEFSQSYSKEKNDEINNRKREQSRELEELSGIKIAKGEKHLIENWCPSENTFNKILTKRGFRAKKAKMATSYNFDAYHAFLENRGFYND